MKVVDLEIASHVLFGEGGFAQLRRMKVRNIREDGSCSSWYTLDVVERPSGVDAIAVIPHGKLEGSKTSIILRRGLRPACKFGRKASAGKEVPSIHHVEVVAGIIERHDKGSEGLVSRVVQELSEEVSLKVDPSRVFPLGPPVYLSPGLMAEQIVFFRAEVTIERDHKSVLPVGDGTLLEEGGEVVIYRLGDALEDCRRGLINDAKTEVALRRLEDYLSVGESELIKAL